MCRVAGDLVDDGAGVRFGPGRCWASGSSGSAQCVATAASSVVGQGHGGTGRRLRKRRVATLVSRNDRCEVGGLVAMAMKHGPCAYCGTKAYKRERGHVVPDCLYPPNFDPRVQRITVPECSRCKQIWQDAETQFRNMLVIAGDPNDHVHQLWYGPISRSFHKASGRRWVADLIEQFVPLEPQDGPGHKVYPGRDQRVMLVIRKIIRGLCHKERVATAVDDRRVHAGVMAHPLPEELQRQMTWKELGEGFFQYGFAVLNYSEYNMQSAWSLTFFEQRKFFGIVSLSVEEWTETTKRRIAESKQPGELGPL